MKALTIFSWVQSERLESGGYVFPAWSEIVGQILSTLSFIGIVAYAIYAVYDAKKKNKVIYFLIVKMKNEKLVFNYFIYKIATD
jgi:hypothetical protein